MILLAVGALLQAAVAGGARHEPHDAHVRCADPSVIADPSGHGVFAFGTGRGIPFWRSSDLRTWTFGGRVFDRDVPAWAQEKVPGATGIWAPDISRFDNLYHLYYAVSTWGSQRSVIGLAVSPSLDPDDPRYGWRDRGPIVESAPGKTDFNAIDPALFVDRDGKPYLFWGSYWHGIFAAPVDRRTGAPAGSGAAAARRVAGRARGVAPPAIEAPYVIRRDDAYYLFVSWGSTCSGRDSTYRVMVGRSRTVLGPYQDARGLPMTDGGGTLVLGGHGDCYGPGHNSVLRTRRGDWLFHHVDPAEKGRARTLQVRPLYWIGDWPVAGEPLTPDGTVSASPVTAPASAWVGRWRHTVDYADPRTVELMPGGRMAPGDAAWSLARDQAVLRWPSPEAPGGAWRDTVVLAPGGTVYVGRNQNGQLIRGERLTGGE